MNFPAVAVLAILSITPTFSWNTATVKMLAPGVSFRQEVQASPPLLVDVLMIDPKEPGVTVAPAVANDSLTDGTGNIRKGRENVSSLVARKGVLAAVNGDYFPFTGDPLGLGVMNGEIYSEPYTTPITPGRAAIGWLPNGQVVVGIPQLSGVLKASDGTTMTITGIDRMTSTTDLSDLVVYTPRYGPTSGARGNGTEIVVGNATLPLQPGKALAGVVTAVLSGSPTPANLGADSVVLSVPAGSPLSGQITNHFHVGDPVTVTCGLRDITPSAIGSPAGAWNDVVQAIGGGPILVRDGKVIDDAAAEGLNAAFDQTLHARTAVGVKADGKILIVTVDDASSFSGGISLPDLAALLIHLGAVNAINLDGGGSTTMVAGGMTVDYPSGSASERPVADMLTVAAPGSGVVADPQSIVVPAGGLLVGQSYPLSALAAGRVVAGDQPNVLWNGPVGGIGYVTQDGVLHALRAGHGTIKALVDGEPVSLDIDIAAPPLPTLPPTANTPVAAPPTVAATP